MLSWLAQRSLYRWGIELDLSFKVWKYRLRRPPKGTKAKSAHDMARGCKKILRLIIRCFLKWLHGWIGHWLWFLCDGTHWRNRAKLPPELGFNEENVHEQTLLISWLNYIKFLMRKRWTWQRNRILPQTSWGLGYEKVRTINVPSFKYVRKWLISLKTLRLALFTMIGVLDFRSRTSNWSDWRARLGNLGDPLMDLGSALAYWVESIWFLSRHAVSLLI